MAATLLYRNRTQLDSGALVEEVIWKLLDRDPERPHGYKYRLAYVRGGERIVGYDQ